MGHPRVNTRKRNKAISIRPLSPGTGVCVMRFCRDAALYPLPYSFFRPLLPPPMEPFVTRKTRAGRVVQKYGGGGLVGEFTKRPSVVVLINTRRWCWRKKGKTRVNATRKQGRDKKTIFPCSHSFKGASIM